MSAPRRDPGAEARAAKGWLAANRFLLLRRLSQFGILALFLAGPLAGIWIVKGNLAYSLTLGTLPLSDPYVVSQSLFAGHVPESLGLVGAAIVVLVYFLVGGRAFCAWVCPLNVVTDTAGWLRQRLGIRGGAHPSASFRHWLLAITLIGSAMTGTIFWETINPVSMLHRGLIYGMGAAWAIVLAVFLFDLFVARNGWCGHLCPVGAFYGLLGRWSPLRVAAKKRDACDDCMDCFEVCPEPKVIRPALKGMESGRGPVILSADCTNCGRCIDVCAQDVFCFTSRFNNPASIAKPEATRVSEEEHRP